MRALHNSDSLPDHSRMTFQKRYRTRSSRRIFRVSDPYKNSMRNFRKNHNKYLILLDISPYLCHIPAIKFLAGGDMGYKQIEPNMTFAEASLLSSMEHNRSQSRDWKKSTLSLTGRGWRCFSCRIIRLGPVARVPMPILL